MKTAALLDLQASDPQELLASLSGESGAPAPEAVQVHVFRKRGGAGIKEETLSLAEAPAGRDLRGWSFVLSLPAAVLRFRLLQLPFSDPEKIREVLPLELDRLLLEEAGQAVFAAVPLPGAGGRTLVVLVDRALLEGVLGQLSRRGVEPRVITSLELRSLLDGGGEALARWGAGGGAVAVPDRRAAAAAEIANPVVNLRTGPLAWTKDAEARRRGMRRAAFLLLALGALLLADAAFLAYRYDRDAAALRREARNLYLSLFPGDKRIADELYQLKSHLKEAEERRRALDGVHPLAGLEALAQATPQGVRCEEIAWEGETMRIKASAATAAGMEGMKAGLGERGYAVSVADMKTAADNRVWFSLVANRRGEGGT